MKVSRRSFVGSIGTGAAALGTLGMSAGTSAAQLVYMPADWHAAEFDKLLKLKARIKQIFDIEAIDGGGFLSPMKNSLNGLHFGFNVPLDQIKIVGGLRGQANLLNFDDSMWEKYRLGEFTKIDDPKTGKPATRNIFYPKKGGTSSDPQDRTSTWQDSSIEALMDRGVVLLSCHNATERGAESLIKRFSLTAPIEDVVHDLQTHTLPGVISVPAMVAAVAMLQSEGHYAYSI